MIAQIILKLIIYQNLVAILLWKICFNVQSFMKSLRLHCYQQHLLQLRKMLLSFLCWYWCVMGQKILIYTVIIIVHLFIMITNNASIHIFILIMGYAENHALKAFQRLNGKESWPFDGLNYSYRYFSDANAFNTY